MAIPPELQDTDPVDIVISTHDFQKGFKKLPDKTSSSPSGCGVTHYKLLAKDKGLSHILARAITLPFQHCFSPTRWRTVNQFMLEKEPGNPLITKLRVIQLLEANMNFAFRLLWGKQLVHHALSYHALTLINFEGSPDCRVHSALLLKTLSYNYIRYTCLNAIIFINDTKAFLDRIIPSIDLMATEHVGMPPTASTCMLATIQGMESCNIHIHSFCSDPRSAPRQWSSTLHMAQHKLHPASCTQHPHYRIPSNLSLLFQNLETSMRSVCRQHGPLANQYQPLLRHDTHLFNAEGSTDMGTSPFCKWQGPGYPDMLLLPGRLVLGPQRPPSTQFQHPPPPPSDPQLVTTSGRSTFTHTIPRVENSIGRRILGEYISPDGSFEDEFSHCQQQALKGIHNISIAPLSQEETYTAYCTMWRPSFEFPLPVASFLNISAKLSKGYSLALF